MQSEQARRLRRSVGCLGVAVVLLIGLAVGGYSLLRSQGVGSPSPLEPRCVAVAGDLAVSLTPEQAHLTAIITGLSVRRGLVPRAGSIAMATVYQESGIRNLDYGDRDSVGLFQQRPSQGWGSVEEIMDPYYSTNRFYDALVEVDGWESGDINDVAQEVQRSGFPEAYRDHEADGRVLASVYTGQSPAALRCVHGDLPGPDPDGLVESIGLALGDLDSDLTPAPEQAASEGEGDPDEPGSTPAPGATLRISASDSLAWAVAAHAMTNANRYGVQAITLDGMSWRHDRFSLADWQPTGEAGDGVAITFTPG